MAKFKRGLYNIVNIHKYIQPADRLMNKSSLPEFRSSWEKKFMQYADSNPAIKFWGSEPFAIKYFCPTDGKVHRYYIDFFLEFVSGQKFLVEVKPYKETLPPKAPKKNTPKTQIQYQNALATYIKNQSKWEAAKAFASQKGLTFIIITERELGV
jgi:hypothetical protein